MNSLSIIFSFLILLLQVSCGTQQGRKKTVAGEIDRKTEKDISFTDSDSSYEFSYESSSESTSYSYSSSYTYSSETYETSKFYSDESSLSIISAEKEDEKILISKNSPIKIIERDVRPIRITHSINSSTSDYHPAISPDGKSLHFTGMDRSGYFDNKVDFTKTKNAGGEDIFSSMLKNGMWQNANPIKLINTNAHEAVNQVLANGDLILSGNFPENMGPDDNSNGSNTSDLFMAIKNKNYQLFHFDEPVNSIFTELDGYLAADQSFILFSSDRPGHEGKYHKKGWLWNGSYWGNTDLYVSFKDGDSWSAPESIGENINTPFTERTPWLSHDGTILFLSSNGYNRDKKDLDIYFFTRKNKNDWKNWEGPYEISRLNGPTDDWGYQEDLAGNGFFARAVKLGYVPTKKAKDGTGFVFETNFRSGYEVVGLQSGSFQKDEQTDIYTVNKRNVAFTLPDILFDVDSYKLKTAFTSLSEQLLDYIKINNPAVIKIVGHTDSDGKEEHNNTLSLNRANAVRDFILESLPGQKIVTEGKGKKEPVAPNSSAEGKSKNRRVEIFFE